MHVTAVCPGFTLSEFHDVTGTRAQVSKLPSWMWMDAPTVARQGFDAVMDGTPIYINGRANRAIAAFVRHLPQPIVMCGRTTTGQVLSEDVSSVSQVKVIKVKVRSEVHVSVNGLLPHITDTYPLPPMTCSSESLHRE